MESLLDVLLVGGAVGGISYFVIRPIIALLGNESGSHDPSRLNSTDQDGRNSVSDTTDRRREESIERYSCKHCGHEMPTHALACWNCDAPKKPQDFLRWQHDKRSRQQERQDKGRR